MTEMACCRALEPQPQECGYQVGIFSAPGMSCSTWAVVTSAQKSNGVT
jgi:hypothetical protein